MIKYVTRWRDKGGVNDLEKARHFIDLLIELEAKAAPALAGGPAPVPPPSCSFIWTRFKDQANEERTTVGEVARGWLAAGSKVDGPALPMLWVRFKDTDNEERTTAPEVAENWRNLGNEVFLNGWLLPPMLPKKYERFSGPPYGISVTSDPALLGEWKANGYDVREFK